MLRATVQRSRLYLSTMAPASSVLRAPRSFAWLIQVLRPRVLRPALAVAAVALIGFGGAQVARQLGEGGPTGTVRGGTGGDGAVTMSLARVVLADGRPALSWTRLPATEDYEVLLIGADLTELGRIGAGADSLLVLEPGRLPAAAARESALVCRIVARRGGDEIGRSNLVPLGPVPR